MEQPLAIRESALQVLLSAQCQPHVERFDSYCRILGDAQSPRLLDACRELAYSEFVPWMCAQNVANKRYFAQQGGTSFARFVPS